MNILNRILLTLAAAAFFAGCAASIEQQSQEQGAKQLSAEEIRATLLGSTLYIDGGQFGRPWELAQVWSTDGTMRASMKPYDEDLVTGKWDIIEDNLYCRQWDNDWNEGKRGCYQFFLQGTNLYGVKAKGSAIRDFKGKMMPGNPYNL